MIFYYYGHVEHMITYMTRHAIVNMTMWNDGHMIIDLTHGCYILAYLA
jgi:hypothetical protein